MVTPNTRKRYNRRTVPIVFTTSKVYSNQEQSQPSGEESEADVIKLSKELHLGLAIDLVLAAEVWGSIVHIQKDTGHAVPARS